MIMQLGCAGCGSTRYSAIYEAFSPRSLSGMGALTMEQAREIAMYGPARGYTEEQIREAVAVIYPAADSEGRLVSAERLESGEFTLTESGVAVPTRNGDGGTTMTVPPKPVYTPPAYYPMEKCDPMDSACVSRNSARQSANMVIQANAKAALDTAMCQHNAARNNDQARYDQCAGFFPQQLLPGVPGGVTPAAEAIDVTPTEVEIIPGTRPGNDVSEPPRPQPGVIDVAPAPGVLENIFGPLQDFTGDIAEKTGLSTTALLVIAGVGLFLLIKK